MAGPNLSEQVEALVAILVRQHQDGGRAEGLRLQAFGMDGRASLGKVAKLVGASPEAVRAWEIGSLSPATNQALRWLSVLYLHQPPTIRAQTAALTERMAAARPADDEL